MRQGRKADRKATEGRRHRKDILSNGVIREMSLGADIHKPLPRDREAAASVGMHKRSARRARGFMTNLFGCHAQATIESKLQKKPRIRGLKAAWDETAARLFLPHSVVCKLFPEFKDVFDEQKARHEDKIKRLQEKEDRKKQDKDHQAADAVAGPSQASAVVAEPAGGQAARPFQQFRHFRLRRKQPLPKEAAKKRVIKKFITKPSFRVQVMQSNGSLLLTDGAHDNDALEVPLIASTKIVSSTKAVDLVYGLKSSLPVTEKGATCLGYSSVIWFEHQHLLI